MLHWFPAYKRDLYIHFFFYFIYVFSWIKINYIRACPRRNIIIFWHQNKKFIILFRSSFYERFSCIIVKILNRPYKIIAAPNVATASMVCFAMYVLIYKIIILVRRPLNHSQKDFAVFLSSSFWVDLQIHQSAKTVCRYSRCYLQDIFLSYCKIITYLLLCILLKFWCLTSKIQKTDKQNAKKWWNVSTKRNTHHFFWIIENFWNVFFTALKCHLNRILKICKSAQDVKIWNRQRCYCKAVRLWTVWCLSPAQVQPE